MSRTGTLFAGGLGLSPYALALLAIGAYLLVSVGQRIEAGNDRVTLLRRRRIQLRCHTRDIQEVRVGFLSKKLVFRDGTVIRIPDLWVNSDRVTAFFRHYIEGKSARQWDDPLLTGKAALLETRRAAHPAAGPEARARATVPPARRCR